MIKHILFSAMFLLSLIRMSSAQEKTVTRLYDPGSNLPARDIDIRHLGAELSLNPVEGEFSGKATFFFTDIAIGTDSVVFYTPSMTFKRALLDDKEILFQQTGEKTVFLFDQSLIRGEEYTLTLSYTSTPNGHCNIIGWDDPAGIKRKQVWAHRPFGWLPYKDDRLTMDLFITFDSVYRVFSNGVRVDVKENEGGTRTWHYMMEKEHPFFSTALVIGDYRFKNIAGPDQTPLEMWYYPEWESSFKTTYLYMEKMIPFFEKEFGMAYPYELYRQAPVTDYLYAAMETTTSTVFGDYLFVGPRAFNMRNYVNVNAHELSHQWFGNCISHLRPCDVWLTESFATYYGKMFEKHVFGEDYYQAVRLKEWEETMEAARKDGYPVGHSRGGRARWYPKGSLIMDMLRYVLGEHDFLASISLYMNTYAFGTAETSDFFRSVWKATGKDLGWFFDQWILRGGEPAYEVDYRQFDDPEGNRLTVVNVEQVHEITDLIHLFKMPVGFEVHYTDGSYDSMLVWIEKQYETIEVPNFLRKEVSFVLFDPGRQVLKNIRFERSPEELMRQAMDAPSMIDRYDALAGLKDVSLEKKRESLHSCYHNEKFYLNRAEVVKQLAGDPESYKLLSEAINSDDPLVRRAVVENVVNVPADLKKDYETLLNDSCYTNLGLALHNLCSSFPEDRDKYLEITKDETGWRGMNIRMVWLEIAISAGKDEYMSELVAFSGKSYDFETRINALNTLQRLNQLNEKATENLLDACTNFNFRLSGSARENLSYFYRQNTYRNLIDETLGSMEMEEKDKGVVRRLLENYKKQ